MSTHDDDMTEPPSSDDELGTMQDDGAGPSSGIRCLGRKGHKKPRWALNGPQEMEFDKLGRAVTEPEYSDFNGYVCAQATNPRILPLSYTRWDQIPPEAIERAWANVRESVKWTPEQLGHVEGFEDIRELVRDKVVAKIHERWKDYKRLVKNTYYTPNINLPRPLPCDNTNIPIDQWQTLVNYWDTEEAKVISEINKKNRSKLDLPHTGGRRPFAVARRKFAREHGHEATEPQFYRYTHTKLDGNWVNKKAAKHMVNMEAYIQKKPVETQQSQEVGEEAFMEEFGMKDSRSRAYQAGCGVSPYEVRSSLSLSSRSQRVRDRKEREAKERAEREAERLRVHEEKLTARFEAKFQGRLEKLENDMDRRVGMEVQKQVAAINWNASMSQEYRQMYGTQFQHGPALSWPFSWTMPGGDTPHSTPHPHMAARIDDPYLTTSRFGDYRPDMSFVSRENDSGDDD